MPHMYKILFFLGGGGGLDETIIVPTSQLEFGKF